MLRAIEKEKEADIRRRRDRAKEKIKVAAQTAFTLGCIPGFSIFSLQGPIISGYNEINNAFDISMSKDAVTDIVGMCIASIVFIPFFAIPVASGHVAKEMVEDECNKYLDAVTEVYRQSSVGELADAQLTAERIKRQMSELLKNKRS